MPFLSFLTEGVPFNEHTSANDPNTLLSDFCIVPGEYNPHISTLTRQIKGFVHHKLLSKANVTEVLFALPDSNDLSTLLEYFHNDLFCPIFRQATHKNCLTSWWPLSCCRWRQI